MACDVCGLAPDHFVDVEVFDVCRQARNWGWHVSETRNAPGTEGIEVYCPTCWEYKQWIDRTDDPLDQPIDLLDRQEKRDRWRATLTSAKAEGHPKPTLYTYHGKPMSQEEFDRVFRGFVGDARESGWVVHEGKKAVDEALRSWEINKNCEMAKAIHKKTT